MKTITLKWLRKQGACSDGLNWFKNIAETDTAKLYELVMASDDRVVLEYANWGIARLFTHEQAVQYAVYAAELALKRYDGDDDRPKAAIAAAKAWLANPCEATHAAAHAAAYAADAAAYAAADAADAAYAAYAAARAIDAAYAARAAYAAADAAYAAAYAADAADAAYAAAARALDVNTLKQCIEYGYTLITKQ